MGSETRSSNRIDNSRARARHQPADDIAAASQNGDLVWRGPVGKRLCVLVVDDDANAAENLSMMLRTWGHQVRVAGDGAAALEMASAVPPDVVLLDIVMPNLDGCQLARRLRRQARFEDTLLIAILDRADREHRARAEAAGVDLCLIKPVEPSTLEGLLVLEQAFLAHALATFPATPRKDDSRTSAKTRLHSQLPAADRWMSKARSEE